VASVGVSDRPAAPVLARVRSALGAVIRGKSEVIDLLLVGVLGGGHVLVEDVPGVGKTTLAKALARAFRVTFTRVQFTPDVLPSDILGSQVLSPREGTFAFHPGPIFTNVLLADEINRASPRTQSALLEAMNEGQVSLDGQTIPLPDPFFVIATQNPQDFAGTFPLPESQLDRFLLRVRIGYPPPQIEMRLVLDGNTDTARDVPCVLDPARLVALQRDVERVSIDSALANYLHALILATRTSPLLSLGASTRAAMALGHAARARGLLRGRHYCIADDIHDLAVPVLAHRVRLATHADGFVPTRDEAESALREIVARIPVPL
jgi:MoxR-like ATPase